MRLYAIDTNCIELDYCIVIADNLTEAIETFCTDRNYAFTGKTQEDERIFFFILGDHHKEEQKYRIMRFGEVRKGLFEDYAQKEDIHETD